MRKKYHKWILDDFEGKSSVNDISMSKLDYFLHSKSPGKASYRDFDQKSIFLGRISIFLFSFPESWAEINFSKNYGHFLILNRLEYLILQNMGKIRYLSIFNT